MITVKLDRPKVFSAVVFNAEQIQGLPPLEKKELAWDRHERAENILQSSGVPISHDQTDTAFYRPVSDSIHLPNKGQFKTSDRYYATALHELGHSTGHSSRLDRDLTGRFGSASYAKEELRAEIASLLVGNELEIGHDPGQHAAYVGKTLKEDPKEILRASKDAETIMSYVMSHEKEKSVKLSNDKTTSEAPQDPQNVDKQKKGDEPIDISLKLAEKLSRSFSNDADRARFIEKVQSRLAEPNRPIPDIKIKEDTTPKVAKQQEFDFDR